MSPVTPNLTHWLAANAESLDQSDAHAAQLLPALAAAGLLGIGVPRAAGGAGGDVRDAIEAIATVATQSLCAAFVYWGQRAFMDYVLASTNPVPRTRWLPDLLQGRLAGATGLSNVMKHLSQLETLQLQAQSQGDGWRVDGVLPWVSNLRQPAFVAAVAVQTPDATWVLGLHSDLNGMQRSADLDLLALRSSNTAALHLQAAVVDAGAVLASHAPPYLRAARPAFLGMQCALSIGLARAALAAAHASGGAHGPLGQRLQAAQATLAQQVNALYAGLAGGGYVSQVMPLFELRMGFAALVQEALQLELQATGGAAYLHDRAPGFARRWRESAFIPIVTPSLRQLQSELANHATPTNSTNPTGTP